MKPAAQIVAITVFSAIAYGIVHDEITAHLCVEYFTVAHPLIIPTKSPFILGLFWGVAATWWIALLMGLILAYAARYGTKQKLFVREIAIQIARVFVISAASAATLGTIAAWFAASHHWAIPDSAIPPAKQSTFIGVWVAHLTSYCVTIFGGVFIILKSLHKRLNSVL